MKEQINMDSSVTFQDNKQPWPITNKWALVAWTPWWCKEWHSKLFRKWTHNSNNRLCSINNTKRWQCITARCKVVDKHNLEVWWTLICNTWWVRHSNNSPKVTDKWPSSSSTCNSNNKLSTVKCETIRWMLNSSSTKNSNNCRAPITIRGLFHKLHQKVAIMRTNRTKRKVNRRVWKILRLTLQRW